MASPPLAQLGARAGGGWAMALHQAGGPSAVPTGNAPDLDACILRYANARRACYGSDCDACLTSLDEVASSCLHERQAWAATRRGRDFIQRFRAYRFVNVGRQCLRSVDLPSYERIDELTCGDLLGSVSERARPNAVAASECTHTHISFMALRPSLLPPPAPLLAHTCPPLRDANSIGADPLLSSLSPLAGRAGPRWLRLSRHRVDRRLRGRVRHQPAVRRLRACRRGAALLWWADGEPRRRGELLLPQ